MLLATTQQEETVYHTPEVQLKLSLGLTPEDAEEVLRIANECPSLTAEDLMFVEESAWETAFSSLESSSTFVKAHIVNEEEEQLIGFACFGKIPGEQDYYELFCIAVDDSFQNIGIGAAILDEVERQVKLNEGKMVFCEIPEGRTYSSMQYFLKAVGYDIHSRHYKFFIPSKGNLVYARSVEGLTV